MEDRMSKKDYSENSRGILPRIKQMSGNPVLNTGLTYFQKVEGIFE